MSFDHKPTDPIELERITKAGGHVGVDNRVNGGLNLSRAIGIQHCLPGVASLDILVNGAARHVGYYIHSPCRVSTGGEMAAPFTAYHASYLSPRTINLPQPLIHSSIILHQ